MKKTTQKDLLILGIFTIIALALAIGILFYGYNTTNISVPVSVIARGAHAPIQVRENYVIRNEKEWRQFRELFAAADAPTLPPVDFSKKQVLVVFSGVKPTSGYSVKVSKVTDTNKQRIVTIAFSAPGSNCIVTQSQTSPYEIVTVPVKGLPLTHVNITKTHPCS